MNTTAQNNVSPTPPNTNVRSSSSGASLFERLGMLPVLVVLYIVFYGFTLYYSADGTSNFASTANNMNIVRQVAINLVLASGMTFVILTAGIDLSVGSMLAVSAVLGMQMSLPSAIPELALPTFLVVGLLCGLINGTMIAYFEINPFIITLGMMTALRGAAYLFADGTTVLNSNIPSFDWLGNGEFLSIPWFKGGVYSPVPIPWLVWIAGLVVVISWFILRKTILGLHVYAVGGNPMAARLTGIKVSTILIFVYSINGLFSGVAGAMSSSRLYAANGNWGTGYELDAIAAVVLGGTSLSGGVGSIWGTVIGALIIGVMNNGLTILGLSSFWQYVAKGIVIVLAVLLDKWRQKQNAAA